MIQHINKKTLTARSDQGLKNSERGLSLAASAESQETKTSKEGPAWFRDSASSQVDVIDVQDHGCSTSPATNLDAEVIRCSIKSEVSENTLSAD